MITVIVLSGPIGAGKSSLTSILAKHLGSTAYYEEVNDNPVLPLYYKDMKRYTFLLNTYFLNRRLAEINEAAANHNDVLDRSIYEDLLFFNMNVDSGVADPTEYQIYHDLMDNMMEDVPGTPRKKPDLLIYIHVSLETMLKRIGKRGREYEQLDTDPSLKEYYENLLRYYEPWYEQYDVSPKMMIDGDKYDFVDNIDDQDLVLDIIDTKLREIGNL
ncbi:Deoxyadenosine kinase [Lactobacillus equicursoris DSM 19284 = JCM 14600 = CIP 110162]|mgnify:FL=1|uniref:Deoxyadenosine kinase n=3 Tax=Lactobacillus equicursoris TaxID=420645 RepID=K0NRR0_9LACO|nr:MULTISPECIES: deoxynucleoside kinase [Lactobacillus]KRL02308.1 deoxyadenosine kinase [Lactobacillus equicursoris DSM 19284 = JCM 14600 = CIP 110162]MCH3983102.1 deoxynucleoside kinase [Lactobacillus delbrueckii]MCH4219292.1 deoxynucleoside kinase [Lactobacillus delbrueckii]MCH4253131.1 deoxynucleoside kinase [Lactobacillus delbrueckii]MDD6386226.1 deoxynucleoside kinase [Lactobacillus equicursoris]